LRGLYTLADLIAKLLLVSMKTGIFSILMCSLLRSACAFRAAPRLSASIRLKSTAETTETETASEPTTAESGPTPLVSVPSSFGQAISCAYSAAAAAMAEGYRLLEVEFPPLPTDMMDSESCSAYQVSKANVALAVDLARKFVANDELKVAIVLPDTEEALRASEQQGTNEPFPQVSINSLTLSNAASAEDLGQLFMGIFGKGRGKVQVVEGADVYIMLVFSCQELPQIEELANLVSEQGKTLILFNLGLETLRGDLGLPAFPPKSLQYGFLSKCLPVYFLRVRSYSKSIAKQPFIVNYQGALFRAWPGAWQTMLDVGNGNYRRIQKSERRPGLGEFKVQLTEALKMGDEGKVNTFFRQGYKTSTWWEDDEEKEESSIWRS